MSKNNTNIKVNELAEVLAWEMSGIEFSDDDAWAMATALYRSTQDYADRCEEIEGYDGSESFYYAMSQRYKENIFPEVEYD
jgi:hypothetical protein